MRVHIRRNLLLGAMLLTFVAGCRTASRNGPESLLVPPQSSSVPDGSPRAAAKELPKAEAVRVCLATASTLAQKGQDREAIGLFEKAYRLDPSRTDIHRRLAVLHDRQDDFQKAMEEYEKAVRAEPKNPHVRNDIGYSNYCRGRFAEAEKSLREAVRLDPKLKIAWTNLGLTLAQQGRIDESHEAFSKAVPPAQAWSNIGFILMAQGKKEEAREAYHRALDLDPDLPRSREALSYLDNPAPRDAAEAKRSNLAKASRNGVPARSRNVRPSQAAPREGMAEWSEEPIARGRAGRNGQGVEESEAGMEPRR